MLITNLIVVYYHRRLLPPIQIKMNCMGKLVGRDAEKGQLAHQKEERRKAVERQRKGLAIGSEKREAFKDIGNALLNMGEKKGAVDTCHREIDNGKKNLQASTNFDLALTKTIREKEATEVLSKIIQKDPTDTKDILGLGEALSKSGEIYDVIENYHKSIELESKCADAYQALGSLLKKTGDEEGAIELLRRAIKADPPSPAQDSLAKSSDWTSVIGNWRRGLEPDQANIKAQVNLGLSLKQTKNCKEAVEILSRALEADPRNEVTLNALEAALEKGGVDCAIGNHRKTIDRDPQDKDDNCNLGKALLNLGEMTSTSQNFYRAEIDPNDSHVFNNLSLALSKTDHLKSAIEIFRKVIKADPSDKEMYFSLGVALEKTGDIDGAIENYRQTIKLDPRYARAHQNIGRILARPRDVKGAIQSFRRAIELRPSDTDLRIELGQILQKTGEVNSAIENYIKAIKIEPYGKQVYNKLNFALKRTEDTKEVTKKVLERFCKDVEKEPKKGYFLLGNILNRIGDKEEAVQNYQKAVSLDRNYKEAFYSLGEALWDLSDLRGAIRNYRRVVEIDPYYMDACLNLGFSYKCQGNFRGAIEFCRKAIKLDPSAFAYSTLGEALYEARDMEGAIENLCRAIEIDPICQRAYLFMFKAMETKGSASQLQKVVNFVERQGPLPDKVILPFQRLKRIKCY